jgi:hypothetical protein
LSVARLVLLPRTAVLIALGVAAGCYGKKKDFEDFNPNIPGSHFKSIATVSGDAAGTAIRLMVQVRQKLTDAGIDAQARSGRWENAPDAVNHICSPGADNPVDGVLIMSYDHMTLFDCQTLKAAYDIQGSPMSGGMGLDEMTKHLIHYLRGNNPTNPKDAKSQ